MMISPGSPLTGLPDSLRDRFLPGCATLKRMGQGTAEKDCGKPAFSQAWYTDQNQVISKPDQARKRFGRCREFRQQEESTLFTEASIASDPEPPARCGTVLIRLLLPHRFRRGKDLILADMLPEANGQDVPRLDIIAPGFAILPFTVTLPPAQASLATVRRRIMRETFRYLSSRIKPFPPEKNPTGANPVGEIKQNYFLPFFLAGVLTLSFRALPALKAGALEAAILISSPVRGLRAVRAGRFFTSKVPKPIS